MCIQKKVSQEATSASLPVVPSSKQTQAPPRSDNPNFSKNRHSEHQLPTQPTQRSQKTVEEVKKRTSGVQKRKEKRREKERGDDDTLKEVPMDMPEYDAEKDEKFDWKRVEEAREAQNKKASTETS